MYRSRDFRSQLNFVIVNRTGLRAVVDVKGEQAPPHPIPFANQRRPAEAIVKFVILHIGRASRASSEK